jgi:hypothetical protein
MSDFFRELEEEIHEERIVHLWRKYGNLIITLAVCIVVATAGYSIWKYMAHQNKLKKHISFSQAVNLYDQGKQQEALAAFQAIVKDGGGYGKLAQLYEASLTQQPEALYTQIATENASDPGLGNLPKILKASRDLTSAAEMTAIQPLSAPRNAWAPLALELLAFSDLRKGEEIKAAEQFIRILKESSNTIGERVRAEMMLSQMNVPAYLFEDEKKESQ